MKDLIQDQYLLQDRIWHLANVISVVIREEQEMNVKFVKQAQDTRGTVQEHILWSSTWTRLPRNWRYVTQKETLG
jgi:predicted transcriptional regulator